MKRILPIFLIAIILLSACSSDKGIEVHNAWMRPATKGANGGVYFELHNHSSTPDELTSITSEAAVVAEIHQSTMEGDVMKMSKLESLPLEKYADIAFEPGGLHIMLVDLRQDYKLNDEYTMVLHFKNYEDITVHVIVRDNAPADNGHDM